MRDPLPPGCHRLPFQGLFLPESGTVLKTDLKTTRKYKKLHNQSSQRVVEELAGAFNSWYGSNDDRDNSPVTAEKTTTTTRVVASTKNTPVRR